MKNYWHIGLFSGLFLLLVVFSQRVGRSQPLQSPAAPTVSQRLMPSDLVESGRFGSAVALEGNTAVVGADSQNDLRGAAYIYTRSGGVWSETKKLIASDGANFDQFGLEVALSGDTIVIAAPFADIPIDKWRGVAYVYERHAGGTNNWGEVKKLVDILGDPQDVFGSSVAIQGDLIAVGIPGYEDDGAVLLFERNKGGANNWGWTKRIEVDDNTLFNTGFGSSVALAGDLLVVGNKDHVIDNKLDQGSAYIFERNAGGPDNWGEVKMLFDPAGTPEDQFGRVVAISEDHIAVGAPRADVGSTIRQGAVYVYSRDEGGSNNWGLVKKVTAVDGAQEDNFGYSISLSGDLLLVGAEGDDILYQNQGSAYLFGRDEGGANNWGLVKKMAASDAQKTDHFGDAVALDGETALIGASGVGLPDIFEYFIGAVYVTSVVDYPIYLPFIQR